MTLEAKQLQLDAVSQLVTLAGDNNKTTITFKAPTGSGKTHMMGDFMNRILSSSSNIVFLVSAPSKSGLAEQNHESFIRNKRTGLFPFLDSYLISSECSTEEGRPYIAQGHNVYVLPTDLDKSTGRLTKGSLQIFLSSLAEQNKQVYLIKDECQITTKNLDALAKKYKFAKVFNFSATPDVKDKKQIPDVEITDERAIETKLIKNIVWGSKNDSLEAALRKLQAVKEDYRNNIGVNPCLIIQISNKDKGQDELNNTIKPLLSSTEFQDLKWMAVGAKASDYETNDAIGKKVAGRKALPVDKWKKYAKEPLSTIDVIIFKLAIAEGWDIPRACMLYQIRDTDSERLDWQVMGRVRRNPRLHDIEHLSGDVEKLALTAWVWGVAPEDYKPPVPVKLKSPAAVNAEIRLKTTYIDDLTNKTFFDIHKFMNGQPDKLTSKSIFSLYRNMRDLPEDMEVLQEEYIKTAQDWFKFASNVPLIKKKADEYKCDYRKSLKLKKDEVSFPCDSQYADFDTVNYAPILNGLWQRQDGNTRFKFDSQAEKDWAVLLKDLATEKNIKNDNVIKKITDEIYLWGKNYIQNSEIKFAYYLNGVHFSYPDFIMKDAFERIHIFEVKSVNRSTQNNIDSEAYKEKIRALRDCYKYTSALTGYIFYIPIQEEDDWKISKFEQGNEDILTEDMFRQFVKTP